MGKLLSAGLVAVALFAIPMELTAQCAKCHDPLFGKEHCHACSSGPSCGASCSFDHAGNCYLTAPCGGEIKPTTIPVLDHLAAMSVALNSDALEGIGEAARGELIEDGMLVVWNCDGTVNRVLRFQPNGDVQIVHEPVEAAILAERRLQLRLALLD